MPLPIDRIGHDTSKDTNSNAPGISVLPGRGLPLRAVNQRAAAACRFAPWTNARSRKRPSPPLRNRSTSILIYKKYTSARGLPILSSGKVPNRALIVAADVVRRHMVEQASSVFSNDSRSRDPD